MMNKKFHFILRPSNLGELKFQDNIVEYLNNSIKNDMLFNSYLFYGHFGVGKTSTARIFAKTINCQNLKNINNLLINCNNCISCKIIDNQNHPDYKEIDAASNRGIDDIRNLKLSLKYHPSVLKYKILLLDECHSLTNEASESLLKILEDTPPQLLFLLVTTKKDKVISTIADRTQKIHFNDIDSKSIHLYLNDLFDKYNIKKDQDIIECIKFKANNSLRNALNLFELTYNSFLNNIAKDNIYKLLSVVPFINIENIYQSILKKDIQNIINITTNLHNNGFDLKIMWQQFLYFVQQKLLIIDISNNLFFILSTIVTFISDLFVKDKELDFLESIFNNFIIIEIKKILNN